MTAQRKTPRKLTQEERELAERMPVAMVEQCREQDIPDLEIIERVAGYVALSFERLAYLESLLTEAEMLAEKWERCHRSTGYYGDPRADAKESCADELKELIEPAIHQAVQP